MYYQFFGLRKEPFGMTPDPAFLFLSAAHREALAGLTYAILGRKGFVVLTDTAHHVRPFFRWAIQYDHQERHEFDPWWRLFVFPEPQFRRSRCVVKESRHFVQPSV